MYSRKRKQGIYWYSDFWYEGERYMRCWGVVSKTVAREKEMKFSNEVASGKYERRKKNVLFEKMVEQYLEYSKVNKRPQSYGRDITSTNALLTFFKGKSLTEIHPFLLEKYKKKRLETVMPATVNRELACLKNMYTKAKSWKHVKENPVKEVQLLKEEKKDITILTPEKDVELLNELKPLYAKDMVQVALNAGMRKREILDLTKDNVDIGNRMIHVTHTKNWEIRDIPMNELLTRVLKEAIGRSPVDSPYVFTNPRTGKPFGDIKNGFQKAVRKIGLKGFRFHDLRHTWCSRMCELGVDEATIMELGGWKTRSMINRYAHPSTDHKREVLERLNKVPLILPLVEKDEHPSNLTAMPTGENIRVI
jgi:integrase